MKRNKTFRFLVVVILVAFVTVTSITGFYLQNGDFKSTVIKGISDIRWGIDIRGGVEATFRPAGDVDATQEDMNGAKAVIENRMVSGNITDYEIYTDAKNNRIIVRFPWKSEETDFDPEAAIEELAATAVLTFREGNEYLDTEMGSDGQYLYRTPTGVTAENIVLEGKDVKTATPEVGQDPNSGAVTYQVKLVLTEEGTDKFAEATANLVNSPVSIWMDDVMVSAPTVNEAITTGEAYITGDFDSAEATSLANKIQGGALPFALETSNFGTINPTLGLSALDAMAMAGIIAFALIAVLMIFWFRLPGLIAVFSLAGQMGLTFAAISGYFPFANSFTMTLPGIAGMILSIGVGVDANIITASRIREELENGRTLDKAVSRGCENSFWAVFDGNITILIVAIMLIGVFGPSNILSSIFGESTTGSIYSFGYTLLVGTIGNLIMGIGVTRVLLKYLSGVNFLHKPWLFGGAGNGK